MNILLTLGLILTLAANAGPQPLIEKNSLPAVIREPIPDCKGVLENIAVHTYFFASNGINYLKYLRDGSGVDQNFSNHVLELEKQMENWTRTYLMFRGPIEIVRENLRQRMVDGTLSISVLNEVEMRIVYAKDIDIGATAELEIRKISDQIGFGVFAKADLQRGAVIGEYTGVFRKADPLREKGNNYLFAGPFSQWGFIIDAKEEGNITRFINHSVRTANVEVGTVFHKQRWHVILVAAKNIETGEQLKFNYGENFRKALGLEDL